MTDLARRAWEAMGQADNLPPTPELEAELEAETDLLHAFYSSREAGSGLSWIEFLETTGKEDDSQ